jgi:hypothetical protein
VTIVVSPVMDREDFKHFNVTIYPNPASTEIFIKIPEFSDYRNVTVTIFDLNGRKVTEKPISSALEKIDIANLESGVYIFNITSNRGKTVQRIVKSK